MRYLILTLLALFIMIPPAQAGEVVECGTPKDVTVKNEAKDYCDFHSRRFIYKEKRDALRASIEERRETYMAPHQQALENYKEAEQELYNSYVAEGGDLPEEALPEDPIEISDDESKILE